MLVIRMALVLMATASEPGNEAATVEVAQSQICIPEGFYLLVRRKGSVGAIRLQHIKALKEPGTGEADYESYFSHDGGGLSSSAALQRRGRVTEAPLVGLGRLSVQPGETRVRVGPFSFDYSFPGCLGMYEAGKAERDEGFEFAPTDIKDLKQLDVAGPWRWFRVEKNRRISLSLGDLRRDLQTTPKP